MLKINDFFFNDHAIENPSVYKAWQPEDPEEIDEWIQVLVGPESGGGHWFQVHICDNNSIKNILDNNYIYKFKNWSSLDALVIELEEFINKLAPDGENYLKLSKH